ncbi:MAG: DUF4136 domain-containing protein [Burkholderiaceae bacterium]|nr:DUF4136 domain-containing protein [Burkholderiaceae bacterium]
MTKPRRRTMLAAAMAAALAATLLAGCAALNTMPAEISTWGDWPADRKPGRYAFDRLPSQAAQPEAAARLEDAARAALEAAGFSAAAPGDKPDVLVQVAARNSRADLDIWADPLWWRGGWMPGRRVWVEPLWWPELHARTRYEREVALLLRDAESGKPLYEARASNEGANAGGSALQQALFRAALADFPRTGPNPRQVTVTLP